MITDGAVLAVDRHAGKVTDVLVGARKLVEQRGLTAVLVAGEGKMQRRALGHGRLGSTGRIRPLAECRVLRRADCGVNARAGVGVVHAHELNACGIVLAQRELVATQANLERVAHGGVLHHGDFGARRQTHVQNMLSECLVVRCHRCDNGVLSNLECIELHVRVPPPAPTGRCILFILANRLPWLTI